LLFASTEFESVLNMHLEFKWFFFHVGDRQVWYHSLRLANELLWKVL